MADRLVVDISVLSEAWRTLDRVVDAIEEEDVGRHAQSGMGDRDVQFASSEFVIEWTSALSDVVGMLDGLGGTIGAAIESYAATDANLARPGTGSPR